MQEKRRPINDVGSSTQPEHQESYRTAEEAAKRYASAHGYTLRGSCLYAPPPHDDKHLRRGWHAFACYLAERGLLRADEQDGWHLVEQQAAPAEAAPASPEQEVPPADLGERTTEPMPLIEEADIQGTAPESPIRCSAPTRPGEAATSPGTLVPMGFSGRYAPDDLVEYRADFHDPRWHRGTVRLVGIHQMEIDPEDGGAPVTITSSRGKVRKAEITGTELYRTLLQQTGRPRLGGGLRRTPLRRRPPSRAPSPYDQVLGTLGLSRGGTLPPRVSYDTQQPGGPAELRVIYDGPAELVPVPKGLPMVRSRVFMDWMLRRFPECLNAAVPVPTGHQGRRDPHHDGERGLGQKTHDLFTVPACWFCHDFYEATNCLPGRTRQESEVLILQMERRILIEWNALLFDLLTPLPLRQESAADEAFIDLLCEEERLSLGPGPDDGGGGGGADGGTSPLQGGAWLPLRPGVYRTKHSGPSSGPAGVAVHLRPVEVPHAA